MTFDIFPHCVEFLRVCVAFAGASVRISPCAYAFHDLLGKNVRSSCSSQLQDAPLSCCWDGHSAQSFGSDGFAEFLCGKVTFTLKRKKDSVVRFSGVSECPVPELFCWVVLVPITQSLLSCAQRDSDFHLNHPVLA